MKSIELIEQVTGRQPRGYVAPWWEMSRVTAELLLKYGFRYDHSQGYDDFSPFYARVGDEWTKIDYTTDAAAWMKPLVHGNEIDLVESGANWYLDDLPPMMFIKVAQQPWVRVRGAFSATGSPVRSTGPTRASGPSRRRR